MKKYIIILSGLLFFLSNSINAQYVFRDMNITDGLADTEIRSISMLPDNRIVVGTKYVLDVYDGSSFLAYYHDRSKEYKWTNYKPPKEYYDSENRIWLKNYEYLLLFDLDTNQYLYNIDAILHEFGINKKLINIFIDDTQNYWFITEDKTVTFYDITKRESFVITSGDSDFTLQHGIPREITQYKNLYWIIYSDGLICCWDYTTKEFTHRDETFLSALDATADNLYIYTTDKDRLYMHTTDTGDLWLMLSRGVYFYNKMNKKWTEVCSIAGHSNFFTCMDLDQNGNVWVGTSASGLRFIDKNTLSVKTLEGILLENGNTVYNDIFSIFVDDYNGVWIGTLFKGLYYYHPSMRKFDMHRIASADISATTEDIWSFLETDDGKILVGAGKGLFSYNPANGSIERIYTKSIGDNICTSLYRDSKNRIWVSTFFNGIFCIDGATVRNYKNSSLGINSYPNSNNIRSTIEDKKGNIWSCALGGLCKLDEQSGNVEFLYKKHPQIESFSLLYNIYEVEDGILMVIGDKGVYYYDVNLDSIYIPDGENASNSKFPDYEMAYNCYHKDKRSLEWFGTINGLRIWDSEKNKLYILNSSETGLQSNIISAILEDNDGTLWISTVEGISSISVTEERGDYSFSCVNFSKIDGLDAGRFNRLSAIKASDGTMYFGGVYGFNSINSQNIMFNQSKPKAIFTSFSLFNSLISPLQEYNGRIILKQTINRTDKIVLNYDENFITLEFAGLNYVNPQRTYFKYKLENFDSNWNEIVTSGSGKVTYTELPSGTYRLVLYTANSDKIWSDQEAEITIEIKPPFWATTTAIIIYIILIILLLIVSFFYLQRRRKINLIRQQKIDKRRQKEELDQMKYRFFTNVSHEFRTPLTLIITPLEVLLKHERNEELKNKLSLIHNNARNLLLLVNQLLDFRKLEMNGEKLNLHKVDIRDFIQNIYNQFEYTVKEKGIGFILEIEIVFLLILYIDENKMQKVMSNLLSNALKYTPSGGVIGIIVNIAQKNNQEYLKISVTDTGCGISEKDKDRIFNRFYQVEDDDKAGLNVGSGIGLHLSKEYIQLHNGEIYVENLEEGGTVFTLLIPTTLKGNDRMKDAEDESYNQNQTIAVGAENKEIILIVEDNTEFRQFLVEQLSSMFRVIDAADGEKGEKLAIQKLPDLIISDLMMPKIDGIQLCKRLKNNIQTSHIPFVLLTARHSDEAKIEGYRAGADSYISKPFSLDVLLTRVKKLIEQQEIRKNLFQKNLEVTPSNITITSLDEEFVHKALLCVENNMNNIDYSVEDLSKDLALSRVHLYRKLQSITGRSPSDFIRSIRLKRAAQLLQKSQLNISEIAYEVGFNNPKYFTICFKEEFGVTPSLFKTTKENN